MKDFNKNTIDYARELSDSEFCHIVLRLPKDFYGEGRDVFDETVDVADYVEEIVKSLKKS